MSYQQYSSPPTPHPVGVEYDSIMNEVALQMAASQLSRSRYGYQSTPKRWSGRIEKPRSTHTSPATQVRRRAYSTTRSHQTQSYHPHGLNSYSISRPVNIPRAASRPFSWHPSTTQQTYSMSPTSNNTSPAASSYLPTPQIPASNPTSMLMQSIPPLQLPLMQPTYYQYQNAKKPTGPPSMASESSSYPMESHSSSSPNWHYTYDGQAPIMANSTQFPSVSPPDPSWYDTTCSQISPHLIMHPAPLPPILPQPSLTSLIHYEQNYSTANAAPASDFDDESNGEVLVGLGLYDRPDESMLTSNKTKILKLAEAWEPPESSGEDDESSQEDEDEEEVCTPEASHSWFQT